MVENLNILSNLKRPRGKKKGKRLGRGVGSGKGGTCGRGTKGLKARAQVVGNHHGLKADKHRFIEEFLKEDLKISAILSIRL